MADRLGAMRGPDESYSDVILRIGGGRADSMADSAQQKRPPGALTAGRAERNHLASPLIASEPRAPPRRACGSRALGGEAPLYSYLKCDRASVDMTERRQNSLQLPF
jgi:hypothetical protein